MQAQSIDEIINSAFMLIIVMTLASVLGLGGFFWLCWWLLARRHARCPYGHGRLEPATKLSYEVIERTHEFLMHLNSEDNPAFELSHAAVCRETGRIFPHGLRNGDIIKVNWDFLQQRHPGNWVSWGSLSEADKRRVRACHVTLRGFQTENSATEPKPRKVPSRYTLMKPGPLYVDLSNYNLLGWKQVPGTNFELLILQRPKQTQYHD